MLRGCIAIGEIKCDDCKRNIEQGERYLIIEDEEKEDGKQRLCIECCSKKKYVAYVTEKGEEVLTFFAQEQ